MPKKNIVVLVSGGGTNLQALIDAQGRGELGNGEITAKLEVEAHAFSASAVAAIEAKGGSAVKL